MIRDTDQRARSALYEKRHDSVIAVALIYRPNLFIQDPTPIIHLLRVFEAQHPDAALLIAGLIMTGTGMIIVKEPSRRLGRFLGRLLR